MRKYRDQVLRETPEGRAIIRLYYKLSPVVVALLQEDTVLREYLTGIAHLKECRGRILNVKYLHFYSLNPILNI